MRVGALPKYPSNALNYNLTWSTDGLINEYCEPCEAIVNGELHETAPLEELEDSRSTASATRRSTPSGGLGTLCETLAGKARNLNYKTIRYPGHRHIMKALAERPAPARPARGAEGHPGERRPRHPADVVIVFVTVSGVQQGRLVQETYANKIYSQPVNGVMRSAHPGDHRRRHLRGCSRPAGRGAAARARLRAAGGHRARPVPGQPFRPATTPPPRTRGASPWRTAPPPAATDLLGASA
ncbi:MAG: saccharopine dehydrogenase C-terminal domain-containing protein [Caulobacteraceae bacterium]